jgi:hypothetical protein
MEEQESRRKSASSQLRANQRFRRRRGGAGLRGVRGPMYTTHASGSDVRAVLGSELKEGCSPASCRRDITYHKRMPRHVLAMHSSRDLSVMSETYGTSLVQLGSGHPKSRSIGRLGEECIVWVVALKSRIRTGAAVAGSGMLV